MRLRICKSIFFAAFFIGTTLVSEVFSQTRVAILPFQNITKKAEYDWLCSGFSETLTAGLSEVSSVVTVDRSLFSAIMKEQNFQMSDLADESKAVVLGKALSVEKMLLGSFDIVSGRIKADVRIVNVTTGELDKKHALSVENDMNKVFDVYSQLVDKTLESFGIAASQNEKNRIATATKGTSDLGAYENYIKGIVVYSGGSEKEYNEAISLFSKALQKDSAYAPVYVALSRTYANLGHIADVNFDTENKVNDYRSAAKYASRAIKLNKESSKAWSALALVYRELRLRDKMVNAAAKAIQLKPAEYEAYDLLADAYAGDFFPEFKNLDSAIFFRKKSVGIEPKFAAGYRGIGADYLQKGDLVNAEAMFRKALELNSKHAGSHDGLGQVYYRKGDLENAKQEFLQTITLDSRSTFGYSHLGDALFMEGNFREAYLKYTTAIELNPNAAYTYYRLAWMYLSAKDESFRDPGKALEYAATAVGHTDGRNADYWYAFAETYSANSLPDSAVAVIHRAIGLDPNNWEYQSALKRFKNKEKSSEYVYSLKRGESYLIHNKTAEAVKELEEAYKGNPDYLPTVIMLAKACEAQGNKSAALSKWEQAKKLDKEGKYQKIMDAKIQELKK